MYIFPTGPRGRFHLDVSTCQFGDTHDALDVRTSGVVLRTTAIGGYEMIPVTYSLTFVLLYYCDKGRKRFLLDQGLSADFNSHAQRFRVVGALRGFPFEALY